MAGSSHAARQNRRGHWPLGATGLSKINHLLKTVHIGNVTSSKNQQILSLKTASQTKNCLSNIWQFEFVT